MGIYRLLQSSPNRRLSGTFSQNAGCLGFMGGFAYPELYGSPEKKNLTKTLFELFRSRSLSSTVRCVSNSPLTNPARETGIGAAAGPVGGKAQMLVNACCVRKAASFQETNSYHLKASNSLTKESTPTYKETSRRRSVGIVKGELRSLAKGGCTERLANIIRLLLKRASNPKLPLHSPTGDPLNLHLQPLDHEFVHSKPDVLQFADLEQDPQVLVHRLTDEEAREILSVAGGAAGMYDSFLDDEISTLLMQGIDILLQAYEFRHAARIALAYIHFVSRQKFSGIKRMIPSHSSSRSTFLDPSFLIGNRKDQQVDLGSHLKQSQKGNRYVESPFTDEQILSGKSLAASYERQMKDISEILEWVHIYFTTHLPSIENFDNARNDMRKEATFGRRFRTERDQEFCASLPGAVVPPLDSSHGDVLVDAPIQRLSISALDCVYYLRISSSIGIIRDLSVHRRVCELLKNYLKTYVSHADTCRGKHISGNHKHKNHKDVCHSDHHHPEESQRFVATTPPLLAPHDLVAVVVALAQLRFPEPELVGLTVSLLERDVQLISCSQISVLCHYLSVLDFKAPTFCHLLSRTFLQPKKLILANVRVVARLLHAVHLMSFRDDELLFACGKRVMEAIRRREPLGDAHGLFFVLNAFAGAAVLHVPLFRCVLPHLTLQLPRVSANCAVMSWYDCTKMGVWSGRYRKLVVKKVRTEITSMSLKSIAAATTLCFHYLSFFDAALLLELISHARQRLLTATNLWETETVSIGTMVWRALFCVQWLALTPRDLNLRLIQCGVPKKVKGAKQSIARLGKSRLSKSFFVDGGDGIESSHLFCVDEVTTCPGGTLTLAAWPTPRSPFLLSSKPAPKALPHSPVFQPTSTSSTPTEETSNTIPPSDTLFSPSQCSTPQRDAFRYPKISSVSNSPFFLMSYDLSRYRLETDADSGNHKKNLKRKKPRKKNLDVETHFSPWMTVPLAELLKFDLSKIPFRLWQRSSSTMHEEVHTALPLELQSGAMYEERVGPYVIDEVLPTHKVNAWTSANAKRRGRKPANPPATPIAAAVDSLSVV